MHNDTRKLKINRILFGERGFPKYTLLYDDSEGMYFFHSISSNSAEKIVDQLKLDATHLITVGGQLGEEFSDEKSLNRFLDEVYSISEKIGYDFSYDVISVYDRGVDRKVVTQAVMKLNSHPCTTPTPTHTAMVSDTYDSAS